MRRGDGVTRNEIPIHDIAERFVHAHAVDENGEPLRQADKRRGAETAVIERRLKRVAFRVACRGAGEISAEMISEIYGSAFGNVSRISALYRGANVAKRRAKPGKRPHAKDVDPPA